MSLLPIASEDRHREISLNFSEAVVAPDPFGSATKGNKINRIFLFRSSAWRDLQLFLMKLVLIWIFALLPRLGLRREGKAKVKVF